MAIENLRFIVKLCLKKPAQCRYLWRWFKSLSDNYLTERQLPWLVFSAIDFLEDLDLKDKKVFEYGSGGSTLFWLRKQQFQIQNVTKDTKKLDVFTGKGFAMKLAN